MKQLVEPVSAAYCQKSWRILLDGINFKYFVPFDELHDEMLIVDSKQMFQKEERLLDSLVYLLIFIEIVIYLFKVLIADCQLALTKK